MHRLVLEVVVEIVVDVDNWLPRNHGAAVLRKNQAFRLSVMLDRQPAPYIQKPYEVHGAPLPSPFKWPAARCRAESQVVMSFGFRLVQGFPIPKPEARVVCSPWPYLVFSCLREHNLS